MFLTKCCLAHIGTADDVIICRACGAENPDTIFDLRLKNCKDAEGGQTLSEYRREQAEILGMILRSNADPLK